MASAVVRYGYPSTLQGVECYTNTGMFGFCYPLLHEVVLNLCLWLYLCVCVGVYIFGYICLFVFYFFFGCEYYHKLYSRPKSQMSFLKIFELCRCANYTQKMKHMRNYRPTRENPSALGIQVTSLLAQVIRPEKYLTWVNIENMNEHKYLRTRLLFLSFRFLFCRYWGRRSESA